MTDLEKLAPYPETAEQATAKALILHLLVAAKRHEVHSQGITSADPEVRRNAIMHTGLFVQLWSQAALLRLMIDRDPEAADKAAVWLWDAWEDGGTMHELLWEWLTEYGIDPDAITPEPEG